MNQEEFEEAGFKEVIDMFTQAKCKKIMHLKEDKYILKMIQKFYSNAVVDSEKNIITLKVSGTTMNITLETFTNTFKVWNKGVTDMNEYYVDAKTMMKAQHIKGNPSIMTQLLPKYRHVFNFCSRMLFPRSKSHDKL